MSKRILITAGIFIVGITSFNLLNNPFLFDSSREKVEELESLNTIEESILKKLMVKLHKKYVGVDVKTTPNKELVIQVVGDEGYLKSVKMDMEFIAEGVIKNTVLEDYIVVFERWDWIGDTDEMINKEHQFILKTLMKGLRNYQVVDQISIDTQQIIIVHTSIKDSDKNARKVALEIEEKANEILHSEELNSVSNSKTFKIKVKMNGKVIN
ncbi:hypothetical protein ACTHOQ_12230 [Solibacillus silvestris]|uniref:hypothetical protein n=1 Tax=Solibacillus silvestris TaxID=76853 RepID=UPI003F7FF59C